MQRGHILLKQARLEEAAQEFDRVVSSVEQSYTISYLSEFE